MLPKLTAIHLLIILVTSLAIGTAHPIEQAKFTADKRVMEFLLKLNFFDGAVKDHLSKYFTAYVVKMKESKRIYETAYGLCVGKADEDRQLLNYGMTIERNSFDSIVNEIYENFVQCNVKNGSSFIACYAKMAKAAIKQLATAVSAPGSLLMDIHKELQKINSEEERCKKQALDKYNADNEKIYKVFENGLNKKPKKKAFQPRSNEETTTELRAASTDGLDEKDEKECIDPPECIDPTTTPGCIDPPECMDPTTTTECIDPTTTTECIDPTTTPECIDPTTTPECIDPPECMDPTTTPGCIDPPECIDPTTEACEKEDECK